MQKKNVRRLSLALPVLLAFTCAAAKADTTLASTFGPGQGFDQFSGYAIGVTSSGNETLALSFVPNQTATLTGAELALSSGNTSVIVNLFVESSIGGFPDTILDSLIQVGTIPSGLNSIVNFTCASCSTLSSGTEYFLVAQLPDTSPGASWGLTSPAQTGTLFFDLNGSATGPWSDTAVNVPAFSILGSTGTTGGPGVTPEPTSILLLAPGLAGVFALYRRRGLPQR